MFDAHFRYIMNYLFTELWRKIFATKVKNWKLKYFTLISRELIFREKIKIQFIREFIMKINGRP